MSTDNPTDAADSPAIDAAEYVLGTLSDAERAAFEARMQHDRALVREVYAWQDRLLPLAGRVAPLTVSRGLWLAIRDRVASSRRMAVPWWRRLGLWQAASAAALLVAVVLGMQLLATDAAPRYLAVLSTPDNRASWVVELVSADTVRLRPVGTMPAVAADKALQFWTKPEGAERPTSLGLVVAGQLHDIPRNRLPAIEAGQLFEVTLEPAAGSPTGRPTGPILAIGRMVRL